MRIFSMLMTVLLAASCVFAQQSLKDQGIKSYQAGDITGAVISLERAVKTPEFKNDAVAWNFLGLAYLKGDFSKNALKALKKAVDLAPVNNEHRLNYAFAFFRTNKLKEARKQTEAVLGNDPQNLSAILLRGSINFLQRKFDETITDSDKVISLDPSYAGAYTLKSNAILGRLSARVANGSIIKNEVDLLKEALVTLQNGEESAQGKPGIEAIKTEREGVSAFYQYFTRGSDVNFASDLGTIPLKIIEKRPAPYTNEARRNMVEGTIKVAVLFSSTGVVKHVLVLDGLPFGLTENAVRAARNIRFEPAVKDGKPISVVKLVEYSFDIY